MEIKDSTHAPVRVDENLENYLHPIEIKIRTRYLEIIQKHGNGLWALEELTWEIYDKHVDEYNALSEDEKYILNMYMKVLSCLYK